MKRRVHLLLATRFVRLPVLMSLVLLLSGSALAQLEPCGLYDRDGVPGYGSADWNHSLRRWLSTDINELTPDYDGDGIVTVADLARQAACVPGLSRGLLASYYGFDNGDPGFNMTFPDFNNLTFDPTVIKATPWIEEFNGRQGFLNSDMISRFGVVFEGYVFIPENGRYTFYITGREGMRMFLNGGEIMSFDGSPRNDSHEVSLVYGLHPIRIEYYADGSNTFATLSWTSNKPSVGFTEQIIGPDNLFHASATVPEYTVTEQDILFDPPTGLRVNNGLVRLQAWVQGPNGEPALELDGVPRLLRDGKLDQNITLQTGLNVIPYRLTDADGREKTGTYSLYLDGENLPNNGLAVNLYATEWHEGILPRVEDLEPISTITTNSTHLVRDQNDDLIINGRYIGEKTIVEIEGTIQVNVPGWYDFRIDGSQGALFINGKKVAAIGYDYPGQFDNRGQLFLAGAQHWRVVTGDDDSSPEFEVFWEHENATQESLVTDSVFRHGPNHVRQPPDFSGFQGTPNGRHREDLVAEFMFEPGQTWRDSSGNDYDMIPDLRAIQRPNGGVTYQTGGSTAGEEAGVQLASRIVEDGRFALEVDFVYEGNIENRDQRLIALTGPDGSLARIYIRGDDLTFEMFDQDRDSRFVRSQNVIQTDKRFHVVGEFNGSTMRLYINGVLQNSRGYLPNLTRWPSWAYVNVGQPYNRRSGPGTWGNQVRATFLQAAFYANSLGSSAVNLNRNANLSLNPYDGPLTWPTASVFPPVGTTPAELDEAIHILNRMAFGPSPDSVREVLQMGVQNWINQQLTPNSIDDSQLDDWLDGNMFIPDRYDRDLGGWATFRMTHSKRQLLEVMAQFWDNHFNTERDKVDDIAEEWAENRRFREHALGNFSQLLTDSAKNFPMTVYLDSDSNVVGAPNENYAREILELHTYGVDNGYNQIDIEEAARCFTGWTVRDGRFYFNPGLHDYGEKNLLGITIPAGGGLIDGVLLINHLVTQTNTADYIAYKLTQLFIDDNPPADIQAAVSGTFFSTGGDIQATLTTLFNHARFRTDLAYRQNKTKTPLEFGVSILRATETPAAGNSLTYFLDGMGMELFNFVDPTGFAEEGVAWIDTNSIMQRWDMINAITSNRLNGIAPAQNIFSLIGRNDLNTYNDILDFFEAITAHGTQAAGVRAIAESWLTNDNPAGFVIDDASVDGRIRQTLGLYLRLPEFNKQ